MSAKKSTPAKKKTTGKTAAEWRRQLARDITSIFSNPETPDCIRGALDEGMGDLFNEVDGSSRRASEAYNLALLEAYAEQKEKGGARQ